MAGRVLRVFEVVRKGRASGRRNDILHPRVFSVTGPVQEYDELGPSTIPGISTRTVVRIEETKLLDHSAQIISICLSMQVCSWISFKRLTNTSFSSDKKWYRELPIDLASGRRKHHSLSFGVDFVPCRVRTHKPSTIPQYSRKGYLSWISLGSAILVVY